MKIIICLALSLFSASLFTQETPKEVSLVVSAEGATKTEAINNALRSAIEQTFGTFVSANTEILNDQLVKEEIVSVSSGNIQKYSEISSITLPNGNTFATLNVTVSISKLISYAQSKGAQCEFAGATFGANYRMYKFNKKSEKIAIQNLIKQLDALRPIYDYEIKVSDPVLNNNEETADLNICVQVIPNEKTILFTDILETTILSIALTENQVMPLMDAGFKFQKYSIYIGEYLDEYNKHYSLPNSFHSRIRNIYLYNHDILKSFGLLFWDALFDFSISDNLNDVYFRTIFIDTTHLEEFNGQIEHDYNNNVYFAQDDKIHTVNDYSLIFFTNKLELCFNFTIPVKNLEKINKINIISTKEFSTNICLPYDYNLYIYNRIDFFYDSFKKYSFLKNTLSEMCDIMEREDTKYYNNGISADGFQRIFISSDIHPFEIIIEEISSNRNKY